MHIAEYVHDLSQCQTLHYRFQYFTFLPQHPPCYFTF